jgi:hypothetical protein
MFVSVGIKGGLGVQLEVEGSYQPDVLDDMVSRARDLFRLALVDQAHAEAEHDRPEQ